MSGNQDAMAIVRSIPSDGEDHVFESAAAEWRVWGYRLALRITGCPEAAADALQNALIRAFRSSGKLHEVESPRAWFRQILVRCAIDQRPTPSHVPTEPPTSADPAESMYIRCVLAGLDAADRAILALSIGEGLRYSEIAALLEIPEGTVGSRLHHAKSEFRKRWEAGR